MVFHNMFVGSSVSLNFIFVHPFSGRLQLSSVMLFPVVHSRWILLEQCGEQDHDFFGDAGGWKTLLWNGQVR